MIVSNNSKINRRIIPKWPAKVEQAKIVNKMIKEGMRAADIADCLGITRHGVYKIIQVYGLR